MTELGYNNPRFQVKLYDWDVFAGPRAGEIAPDFQFTDLDTGTPVALSDFRGQWVVIETGSSTCSMYTKNIPGMDQLRAQYPDVNFLVVYVREAHPGERLHQHRHLDEKIAAAKILKPKFKESRQILVDSHDGDFHRFYGAKPNLLYMIRPDGVIHYRCDWAHASGLQEALQDRESLHTVEHADMKQLHAARGMGIAIRTMWIGGFLALWDFFKAGPQVLKQHNFQDEYYREHGQFKNPGSPQEPQSPRPASESTSTSGS